MKMPIVSRRCAVHYTERRRIVTDMHTWFEINIAKIHGRRHVYDDLQEYIQSHSRPGVFIPDIRVVTQEVAQQLSSFMMRHEQLDMVVLYDRPDDVPQILRYFLKRISHLDPHDVTQPHLHKLVNALERTGFLESSRAEQYHMN